MRVSSISADATVLPTIVSRIDCTCANSASRSASGSTSIRCSSSSILSFTVPIIQLVTLESIVPFQRIVSAYALDLCSGGLERAAGREDLALRRRDRDRAGRDLGRRLY